MSESLTVHFIDDDAGMDPVTLEVDASGPPKDLYKRLEKSPILIDLTKGPPAVEEPEQPGGCPKFPGAAWQAIEKNINVAVLLSLKSLQ